MQKDTVEADLNKHFSRYEDPLWDDTEEENSKKMIRVKVISPRGAEKYKWKIYENTIVTLTIEGKYLNKGQINYLLTPTGMNFILSSYKAGINTMNKFKKLLCSEVNVKDICKK